MATVDKPVVLLLFGGESPEHEVSIASATNVFQAVNLDKYTVILCYIDKQGQWWHAPVVEDTPKTTEQIMPLVGRQAILVGEQEQAIDVMFPVLHGQFGEDGSIQGLAQLMHVPIVGCDIDASAVCMDKVLTKKLLAFENIPVVPAVTYDRGNPEPVFSDLQAKLGSTLFVKPARQGSSVGVGKARSEEEFKHALQTALHYDDKILIEAGLDVREIEVAVLGPTTKPQASVTGEIVPDREFYDYESKYDEESTSEIHIPAQLSEKVSAQIRHYALRAFTALNCRGLARIDFFIEATSGKVYLNELNTLPGFTNISMYSKLWEASGKPYEQVVTELIELARRA